jgi:hypothetical protein
MNHYHLEPIFYEIQADGEHHRGFVDLMTSIAELSADVLRSSHQP